MLDKIVEVGCGFDVISPVLATIRNVANGPSQKFSYIPTKTGREIQKALKKAGVQSWGWFHVAGTDESVFSVRKADAARAQGILESLDVPITGGQVAAGNSRKDAKAQGGGLLRQGTGGASLARTGPRKVRGRSRLWRLLG